MCLRRGRSAGGWRLGRGLMSTVCRYREHPLRVRGGEGHDPAVQPQGVQPRVGASPRTVIVNRVLSITTSRPTV